MNAKRKRDSEISVDALRDLLSYDAETGLLTWRVRRGRVEVGQAAGNPMKSGYLQVMIGGRTYLAHRLAWLHHFGRWPDGDVDHINRVRTDNRVENLRECPRSANMANSKCHEDNQLGVKGVCWHPAAKKWKASVMCRGKTSFQYFDSVGSANAWVRSERARLHQHFACHG